MDLILSVSRFFSDEISDEKRKLILSSQKGRCKVCQIDIRKSSRINQDDEKTEPYAVCPVCYYSQHLEMLPESMQGRIVMLPDISQVDLIVLSRTIAMFKMLDSEHFGDEIESADLIAMLLNEYYNQSETYYAPGSSEVDLVAQVLSNQSDEDYSQREKGLYGLRWIPDYNLFENEMDYWYKTMFSTKKSPYHPSKWEDMSNKIKTKLKK